MFTDGIVTFTANGKIIYCSEEFSGFLGYSVQILIKKNVEDLITGLSVRNLINFSPDEIQTLTLIKSDSTLLRAKVRLDTIHTRFNKTYLLRVSPVDQKSHGKSFPNYNEAKSDKIIRLFSTDITGKFTTVNHKFFESNEITLSEASLNRIGESLLSFIRETGRLVNGGTLPDNLSWNFMVDNGNSKPVFDCIINQRIKNSGEIEGFEVILKGVLSPPVVVTEKGEKNIVPDCHAIFDELNEPVAVLTAGGASVYSNDAFRTRVLKNSDNTDLNENCSFRGTDSAEFITVKDFLRRKIAGKSELFIRIEHPDGGTDHFAGNLKLLDINNERVLLLSVTAPVESEQILNLSHQLFPGSSISGLRQRNILLNSLLNRIPQGIILFKTGSETIECNISALRLFDYFNIAGRFTGHDDDPYYEITERNHQAFEKLGLYGDKMPKSELYKEIEITTLKGNRKKVAATVLPVNGEYGEEIVKCLILATGTAPGDILPVSESVFASLPFAFFNVDAAGKITVVNKHFYEMFNNYSYRDIGSISAADLFGPGETSDLFREALSSEFFPVTIHGGGLKHAALEKFDIYVIRKEDAGFSDTGLFTIVIVPCTGEKNHKERLKDIETLKDINLVRAGILKIITFKLRETLIGLIGVRDSDEFTDISRMILSESVDKLISNLKIIEVANSIQDKVYVPKPETVDLIELCSESAGQFRESAVKKHLNLNFVAYEDKLSVETDIYLLKGIIFFILENAIKFTEYGSILTEVKKLQPVTGFSAIISVTDTGYGISEDSRENIFFRYKEINRGLNKDYEGLGMGLFLAKSFADALGYKINVESVLGKGSKFSIFVR